MAFESVVMYASTDLIDSGDISVGARKDVMLLLAASKEALAASTFWSQVLCACLDLTSGG